MAGAGGGGRWALAGPLGRGFWRAVQEDKFGKESLLQPQLAQVLDQGVHAKPEHEAHTGQLSVHDGAGEAQVVPG